MMGYISARYSMSLYANASGFACIETSNAFIVPESAVAGAPRLQQGLRKTGRGDVKLQGKFLQLLGKLYLWLGGCRARYGSFAFAIPVGGSSAARLFASYTGIVRVEELVDGWSSRQMWYDSSWCSSISPMRIYWLI